MILEIFCVKDRATETFGNPMFLISAGQAIRSFGDEINRAAEDNQLYKHPDDFDLYSLGKWSSDNGTFSVDAPTVVVRGKDIANVNKESK